MSGSDVLQAIFAWFRNAGGNVGPQDEVPVELKLGKGLFYVGILDDGVPVIELSALLYLGAESTSREEDQISEIAEKITASAPEDVVVETSISTGTDVWAALLLGDDDFGQLKLGSKLQTFVDYSLRTMDEIQLLLHPLDVVEPTTIHDPLTKLSELVGVDELVKKAEELVSLSRVAKLRADEGLKAAVASPHLIFTGNPGTGKTTVARLMGAIYRDIGLLESGHLVEARRSDLVGEYIGQTTPKTEAVIEKSLGGVLFIDEAYTLLESNTHGRSYGDECITTLLLAMENQRGRFALIVAGYPEEMKQFVESNPGLHSRFDESWHFRDYTNEELVDIVDRNVTKNDYILADGCKEKLLQVFSQIARDKFFGNARLAREVFHTMKRRHAVRVTTHHLLGREDLMKMTPDDIPTDFRKQGKRQIGFHNK